MISRKKHKSFYAFAKIFFLTSSHFEEVDVWRLEVTEKVEVMTSWALKKLEVIFQKLEVIFWRLVVLITINLAARFG